MADISKIKDILVQIERLSPKGFAIAFHIRLTAPDFLFQTYPKTWTDMYSEKGLVMVDPIVKWGFSNTGYARWSELADQDDHGVFEQSLAFGMVYGVAIGTETGNSRSFAGLAREDREFTDAEIAQLQGYVKELHDLTASKDGMAADVSAALHRLSVEMTHPV